MSAEDKPFHDRLSWALMLPLSALGGVAAYLALFALEVAAEGDAVGSAAHWIGPLRAAAFVFAAARLGASIAPKAKLRAAAALAAVYAAGALATMPPGPGLWAGVLAGAAAACWTARLLPDDQAEPTGETAA